MKKIVSHKTIHFYDDENNEIMYIDHSTDECIWYFYSDNIINVTADMELYNLLYIFMNNYYDFGDEILQNYKDSNKLIWHSDCYYNPDDKWSIASVSCLNIERNDNCFKIWCNKFFIYIIHIYLPSC